MIVKVKRARIAFCQFLFKAGAVKSGDKEAFSSTFLIPKTDTEQIKKIKDVIIAVGKEKWGEKAPQILKALQAESKLCLRDGEFKSQYDGFDGCMYVAARAPTLPKILDVDATVLTEADGKPYAGCYVNVSFDIWAQDNTHGKRINAKLRAVQFAADGDAFVGSAPADEDEFDDLADTGAAAPAGGDIL